MLEKHEILQKITVIAKYYQKIMRHFGDVEAFSKLKPLQNSEIDVKKTQKIEKKPQILVNLTPEKPKKEEKTIANHGIFAEISNDVAQISSLEDLKNYTQTKQICDIQKHATKIVFGDGNPNAKILVIGEAPGQEEDLAGVPFVGRSGELLMNAFASIKLERQKNFYITNNIFWRPPGNRKPTDEELLVCKPILNKIIEIIKPEFIICVGSVASQNILEVEDSISSLRQKTLNAKNYTQQIFAVYHPSYLLRNPSKKYEMYKDLLFIEEKISLFL